MWETNKTTDNLLVHNLSCLKLCEMCIVFTISFCDLTITDLELNAIFNTSATTLDNVKHLQEHSCIIVSRFP